MVYNFWDLSFIIIIIVKNYGYKLKHFRIPISSLASCENPIFLPLIFFILFPKPTSITHSITSIASPSSSSILLLPSLLLQSEHHHHLLFSYSCLHHRRYSSSSTFLLPSIFVIIIIESSSFSYLPFTVKTTARCQLHPCCDPVADDIVVVLCCCRRCCCFLLPSAASVIT